MHSRKVSVITGFCVLVLVLGCQVPTKAPGVSTAAEADTLAVAFSDPPREYGIRCWWWWLNGNVTKEAITRDLEEMKAKGFSGACIFDAGGHNQRGNRDVPEGPMFGTPAWRELFNHAVKEANRLDLVLSVSIQSGWNLGGPDVTPEEATKHLTWSEIAVAGPINEVTLPLPKTRDGFYRDIAVIAFPKKAIDPERPPIQNLPMKAAFREGNSSGYGTEKLLDHHPPIPGEEDATIGEVIVLPGKPDADGNFSCKLDAGEWVVMRFGYTTSPAHVSTSSGQWQGRVIDYMSAASFNRYWNTHVDPMLKAIGPMAGGTLRYLQTDSWELGGINWTDNFATEFETRTGYSLIPYLPVMAGKIIDDRAVSNAFLADLRKVIADCVAKNHYKVFAEKAREYNLGIQPESAGPHTGPIDGLKNYAYSELIMSEFWSPSPHRPRDENRFFVKQAGSAAQIYNKQLVGAEAFTTIGRHWNDVPWETMKPAFDREACSGLNLVFLHTFTCSPEEMGAPGQEYFAGTHINPNITWWDMSGEFFKYLRRCQYLLQQGEVITDVLHYYGDHVPNIGHLKADDPARVLPGYDYTLIDEDRLLDLSVTQDGAIALPHGITFKLLSLPDLKVLSMDAITKIRQLVINGATVVGPKPERMVSLSHSVSDFEKIADELWGNEDTDTGERNVGKGRVVWGKTAREVLLNDNVLPDLQFPAQTQPGMYDYIHRKVNGADVYFISSQSREPVSGDFAFRIQGKQPEIFDPLTGTVTEANAFRQEDGRTVIPLQFNPYGSAFVVFRRSATAGGANAPATNSLTYTSLKEIDGPWKVHFDAEMGAPSVVDFPTLVSWTAKDDLAYYSGTGVYTTTFSVPKVEKKRRYFLTLGDVQDVGIARVKLNGEEVGVTWTPPFRLEITEHLKKDENALQIEVTNSWRNRLVGDRGLPQEERYTETNIAIRDDWELLEAGLLGPVIISTAE